MDLTGDSQVSYGTNAPFGLQPRMHINGSVWNGQTQTFLIQNAYGTSLFTGDPVTLSGGYLIIATAGSGNPVAGVFQGCLYTTAGSVITFAPYWPASTSTLSSAGAQAYVCIDQTVLYDVQLNAVALVQTDIGANANLVANAGSTISGQSGWALDDPATGNATYQTKVIALVPRPGNTFGTTYNNAYVMINNDLLNASTGTAGV